MRPPSSLLLASLFGASLASTQALAAPPPPPPPGGDTSPYAQPPGSRQAPLEVAGTAQPPPSPGPHVRGEAWPIYSLLRLSGGRAFPRGIDDAWYGRADFGPALIEGRGRRAGPVFHVSLLGVEVWGARGDRGGGAVPVVMHLGYVTPHVYLSAGLGANVVTVDHVDGKTGVGALSPLASANLGLSFGPVHVLADVRAQYRWQFGADDRRLYTAGLAIDAVLD